MTLRTALLQDGCRFTARILADTPDGTCEFSLDCICQPDGATRLEVLRPEEIAGISATVQNSRAEFEDIALDFGLTTEGQAAPLELPELLFRCWTEGYIQSAGTDGDGYLAVYQLPYGTQTLVLEQWLQEDGTPIVSQFWIGSNNFATVTVEDFRLGTE